MQIISASEKIKKAFYAHGKVLLTGEYLVMVGALALAMPVKFGQQLCITSTNAPQSILTWEQHYNNTLIFHAKFSKGGTKILETNDLAQADILKKVLLEAKRLNKGFLATPEAIHGQSYLNFNPKWGLGSSSTFITNLAQWAKVDPFKLSRKTFGGSGYDIACAKVTHPIFYQCTEHAINYKKAYFEPPFCSNLFFIYTGKKVSSSKAAQTFKHTARYDERDIKTISTLTQEIVSTPKLDDFNYFIKEHELILAKILKRKNVKEAHFSDYPGEIKSLGAWGGDFILATTSSSLVAVSSYFKKKGLHTVIPYKDMILQSLE
ncbi:MAG: GYDIA family GHMP kinase [Cytophagales bacterium]|nr:GYDIA family GHMP kinase [Cytophagales bacterium]